MIPNAQAIGINDAARKAPLPRWSPTFKISSTLLVPTKLSDEFFGQEQSTKYQRRVELSEVPEET